MMGKIRPVLILSVEPGDDDRELATFVAHTTSIRGSQFEVTSNCRFLKTGAFNAQDIYTIARSSNKFLKKLGELDGKQIAEVELAVKRWLGI